MPLSESQRRAVDKWHKNNITKIGCSVRREQAEEFKNACKKLGLVPNAIFKEVIDDINDIIDSTGKVPINI